MIADLHYLHLDQQWHVADRAHRALTCAPACWARYGSGSWLSGVAGVSPGVRGGDSSH